MNCDNEFIEPPDEDYRKFTVYFSINGTEIQELQGLDVTKYNKFKDRHNVWGKKGALDIILAHLSTNNLHFSDEIKFIYKSVDMVDFDLIYCIGQLNLEDKFRIINTLMTYSIFYEINNEFEDRFRSGIISGILIEQYIEVKDDGNKVYALLLNYFKNINYELNVEIDSFHYSFDDVDYELCDLEKGKRCNLSYHKLDELPLPQLKNPLEPSLQAELEKQCNSTCHQPDELVLLQLKNPLEPSLGAEVENVENFDKLNGQQQHVMSEAKVPSVMQPTNAKSKERAQPLNECQRKYLINYMSRHDQLARDKMTKLGVLGNYKKNQMWRNLAEELNKLGPHKTVQQWINSWNTMRLNAKSATIEFSKIIKKTGGNSKKPKPPTTHQEEINGLFGNFGMLDVFGTEIGFKKENTKHSLTKKPQKVSSTNKVQEGKEESKLEQSREFFSNFFQRLEDRPKIIKNGFMTLVKYIKGKD